LIVTDADIQRLAASPKREKHLARLQMARHGDGVRAGQIIDGTAEGFSQRMPRVEKFFYLQGNDFCVCRDRPGNHLALGFQKLPQRRVVVHIAVENDMDLDIAFRIPGRRTGKTDHGMIIHRMTVFFRYGADGSPAGMHQNIFTGCLKVGKAP